MLCSWLKVYEGYDMWDEDKVAPDFRNCSISYHGPTAGLAKIFHWSMPRTQRQLLFATECISVCSGKLA